jgi:hypothetical protein
MNAIVDSLSATTHQPEMLKLVGYFKHCCFCPQVKPRPLPMIFKTIYFPSYFYGLFYLTPMVYIIRWKHKGVNRLAGRIFMVLLLTVYLLLSEHLSDTYSNVKKTWLHGSIILRYALDIRILKFPARTVF